MPLQKERTIPGGYTANYHKITRVFFDVLNAAGYCDISVWKDKTAYDAGESSVNAYRLDIPQGDFLTLADPGNPSGLYQTMSATLYDYFKNDHTSDGQDGPLRDAVLVE